MEALSGGNVEDLAESLVDVEGLVDALNNEQNRDNPAQFHDIRIHIRQVWPQDTSGNYPKTFEKKKKLS